MKKTLTTLAVAAAAGLFALTACAAPENGEDAASAQAATADEIYTVPTDAVEEAPNVNGMRFNLSLLQFTEKYNQIKESRGDEDTLSIKKWQKTGEPERDDNGVKVQYWHYDDADVSFTASVEVNTDKLINVGCGTTTSRFMGMSGTKNNSDAIIEKAALMAMAVCDFPKESEQVLKDIFTRTTTESGDSLWYSGFVFNLSTKKDSSDSKNNIMLFRVFPVREELKAEWKLEEYR